jgi:hypothetical protein
MTDIRLPSTLLEVGRSQDAPEARLPLGVAALGAALAAQLGRAMPLAAERVTNRAHDDPTASAVQEGTEPLEV